MLIFTIIMSVLTLIAIALSPTIAVQVQKYIEKKKASEERQLKLFKTLMATRNDIVSVVHVNALNQIDMEFYGDNKDDKKITKSWKSYLEHLGKYPGNGEQSEKTQWEDIGNDKFVDLLMKIGKKLNYEFDIEYLKNDFYTPKAHGDFMLEQFRFRKALLSILEGNKSIGVHSVVSDENKQRQEKLIELLTNVLNGEQEILIKSK